MATLSHTVIRVMRLMQIVVLITSVGRLVIRVGASRQLSKNALDVSSHSSAPGSARCLWLLATAESCHTS